MSLAVVTGSSRGIGRATALALGERGLSLALLGRPSEAQRETERLLSERGVRYRHVPCELEHAASIEMATDIVLRELGAPSVVVNNAGIVERARIFELNDESWQRQLDVNLNARGSRYLGDAAAVKARAEAVARQTEVRR